MRPILTVTANPALDVSTSIDKVTSDQKLRCGPTRLDPGGGGVNVARVVQRLGGQALAVYAAGGPTGDAYRQLIEAEHVPSVIVPISGDTRESFTVDETSTDKQYQFVLQGPELNETEWRTFLEVASNAIPVGGYVVASGSLPPGVPSDFYARIAHQAREREARCLVDASGPALAAALEAGVFLVKPSRRELGEHVGATLDTDQSQVDAATSIIDEGPRSSLPSHSARLEPCSPRRPESSASPCRECTCAAPSGPATAFSVPSC